MKKTLGIVAAVALLGVLSGQAAVASVDADAKADLFKSFDLDSNGLIDLNEAEADPVLQSAFEDGDANEDGTLDLAEFQKMEMKDE